MAFTARDGTTRTALSEINMVPFIDIVLVLLIIFHGHCPGNTVRRRSSCSESSITREITEERLVISLTQDGKIYLQNDPVNINELVDKIKARKPGEKTISVLCPGRCDARVGELLTGHG
jgi:biopolymer transport protein ExbD